MNPVVYNATRCACQGLLLADPAGQLVYVVVVSATYVFDADGQPHLADRQSPVALGDEPYGDPARSSIRRDSMAFPGKPAVDLILDVSAHAPEGRPVGQLAVGVRVGAWTKVLAVSGDRHWSGPLRNAPGAPRPFVCMPLRYERAYGGAHRDAEGQVLSCLPENPAGVGHDGAPPQDPEIETELPNVERPDDRLVRRGQRCAVAGLGVVARHWAPRVQHAGTYDAAWLASRSPMLPTDFDPRFHQCAPVDQQFPGDLAGEWLTLRHLTPDGAWQVRLPSLDLSLTVLCRGRAERHRPRVDTVLVDAEARTVTLVARHCIDSLRRLGAVREIVIGDASPAWLRSRQSGKRYVGRSEPLPA